MEPGNHMILVPSKTCSMYIGDLGLRNFKSFLLKWCSENMHNLQENTHAEVCFETFDITLPHGYSEQLTTPIKRLLLKFQAFI